MLGKGENVGFRSGKDPDDERGPQFRQGEHQQGHHTDDPEADFEDLFQLRVVLLSEVEADDRSHAAGKAHENRGHEELSIQHHGNGRHTGFSCVL